MNGDGTRLMRAENGRGPAGVYVSQTSLFLFCAGEVRDVSIVVFFPYGREGRGREEATEQGTGRTKGREGAQVQIDNRMQKGIK